jgi:hypothetical protein
LNVGINRAHNGSTYVHLPTVLGTTAHDLNVTSSKSKISNGPVQSWQNFTTTESPFQSSPPRYSNTATRNRRKLGPTLKSRSQVFQKLLFVRMSPNLKRWTRRCCPIALRTPAQPIYRLSVRFRP